MRLQLGGSHSTSSILTPRARPQAVARPVDAAQKARIIFELIIKPVFLGSEVDKHTRWFTVASDDDLLASASRRNRERSPLISDLRIP
jgi:hypothetical protein